MNSNKPHRPDHIEIFGQEFRLREPTFGMMPLDVFEYLECQAVNLGALATSVMQSRLDTADLIGGIVEHGRPYRVFADPDRLAALIRGTVCLPSELDGHAALVDWIGPRVLNWAHYTAAIDVLVPKFIGFFLTLSSARTITPDVWAALADNRREIGQAIEQLAAFAKSMTASPEASTGKHGEDGATSKQ